MSDEEYTSRRYRSGGESKLQSLLRSPHSRYADFGMQSDIDILERKVAASGIGNNTQKLIEFLEANVDINRQTLARPVDIAFGEAEREHPDYDFTSTAIVRRVLEKVRSLEWNTSDPRDLSDTMSWLIANEGVPLSAEGRRKEQQRADAREAQAQADHRARVIANITKGKNQFPRWSPQHGKVVNVDSAMLNALTDEQLKAMDEEVAALRQQRFDMDRDQQRELLHEVSNQNRTGYTDQRFTSDHKPQKIVGFDNRPRTVDLDREQPRPYSENPTDSPIRGHASVSSSSDPFISAVTGKEITKTEAVTLAKNDLAAFRKLTKHDSLRLNRILAQR